MAVVAKSRQRHYPGWFTMLGGPHRSTWPPRAPTCTGKLFPVLLTQSCIFRSLLSCILMTVWIIGSSYVPRRGRGHLRGTNLLGQLAKRSSLPGNSFCRLRFGRDTLAGRASSRDIVDTDASVSTLSDVVAFVGGVLISGGDSWLSGLSQPVGVVSDTLAARPTRNRCPALRASSTHQPCPASSSPGLTAALATPDRQTTNVSTHTDRHRLGKNSKAPTPK
jgi:hypothetical protein